MPSQAVEGLKTVYTHFCCYGFHGSGPAPDLDNVKFTKMLRDAGVIGKRLSPGDADLIFHKSVPRGSRRLPVCPFIEFTVPLLAHALNMQTGALSEKLSAARPKTNATEVDDSGIFEKLTDQTKYTGMYAVIASQDMHLRKRLDKMLKEDLPDLPAWFEPALKEAARRFGGVELDLAEDDFFRMVRDAELINQNLTYSDVSEIFQLCKEKYADVMGFDLFAHSAVPLITAARLDDIHKVAKKLADAQPLSAAARMRRAANKVSIFEKLCNPMLFTGTHKAKVFEAPSAWKMHAQTGCRPASVQLPGRPNPHAALPDIRKRPATSQGFREHTPSTPGVRGGSPSEVSNWHSARSPTHPLLGAASTITPPMTVLPPCAKAFRDCALGMGDAQETYISGRDKLDIAKGEEALPGLLARPDFDTHVCFNPEIVI